MVETVPLVVCLGLYLHSRRGRDVSQVGCDINAIETHCRNPSRRRSAPTWLNRSRNSIAADALEFIPQGHRYDVLANIRCQSLPTPRHTLLPYIVLCAFFHQRLIPLRIAHFDCLMALTPLSRWPLPPRSCIHLAALRSRIGHRGVRAALFILIDPTYTRSLAPYRRANPCLIPACGWTRKRGSARDARPHSRAHGARLAPSPQSSSPSPRGRTAGRVHAPNSIAAATSLPASLAAPAHLVRLSMEVDGNGDVRRWGWKCRFDEDGEKRSRGCECRWRRTTGTRARTSSPSSSRLTLWFGAAGMVEAETYPLVLPTRLRLRPRSGPHPRPVFRSPPLCGIGRVDLELRRYAYALAEMEKRGCGYVTGAVCMRATQGQTCKRVHMRRTTPSCSHSRVMELSKRDVRAYRRRRHFLLPTQIPRARAPQIWVGTERCGSVVSVQTFCPPPSSHSLIFLSSLSL
ncbi:hypothetical protein B0H13DRAFT_2401395 [Mycena leptocephala]|nr:hypothetical protein B0H13DRAFT_2401395 [Mycena leptocephala]